MSVFIVTEFVCTRLNEYIQTPGRLVLNRPVTVAPVDFGSDESLREDGGDTTKNKRIGFYRKVGTVSDGPVVLPPSRPKVRNYCTRSSTRVVKSNSEQS